MLPTQLARHSRLAAACLCTLSCCCAAAQGDVVTITARPLATIGGFGGVGEARSPLAVTGVGSERLGDLGARTLADLVRVDPAVADAYNAEGYWSALAVRGYVLDARYNYRRDGLPISAETWLPLANKERVEILKGTTGVQAGTSSPGGLANLVVKRPSRSLREARLEWREDGTLSAAADLSERFGADGRFGARLNLAAERLRPPTRAADGSDHVFAFAADMQVTPATLLEVEFERSHHRQPSAPGFSLLGAALPDARAIDPRTNLNNQAWSLPVVFDGSTGSLRWQQRLAGDRRLVVHGAVQRLRSDDRVAFPFGCTDAATGAYYADRYCPDGSYDLYDYRSEGETRRLVALDMHVEGSTHWVGMPHDWVFGLMHSRASDRLPRQAFNYVGSGSIQADRATLADPTPSTEATNRDEHSTALYARDRVALTSAWQLWAGARITQLRRASQRTDNSEPTAYDQTFASPFVALTHQLTEGTMLYASAGAGTESEVVPNRARYINAGQALPALRSRQVEAGIKRTGSSMDWSLIAFDIRRPQAVDACDGSGTICTRVVGPQARHRGAEASLAWRQAAWDLQAGAQLLHAELNGTRPANVPRLSARLQGGYWAGTLALQAGASYEGPRTVVPGETLQLPGWTRWDAHARWRLAWGGGALTARIGVDNLTDRRAWRESPYQFGHAYLFPLAPRTWRVSVSGAY